MTNDNNIVKKLPQDMKAFHYTACGLDNIFLVEGVILENDGGYAIPSLDALHNCIAMTLIHKKQKLNGKEFRFLRKELEFTQKDIADEFGVDVQTVARWEKEETEGASFNVADRLIRIIFLLKKECIEEASTITKDIATLDSQYKNNWLFEVKKSQWQFSRTKVA